MNVFEVKRIKKMHSYVNYVFMRLIFSQPGYLSPVDTHSIYIFISSAHSAYVSCLSQPGVNDILPAFIYVLFVE